MLDIHEAHPVKGLEVLGFLVELVDIELNSYWENQGIYTLKPGRLVTIDLEILV